MRNLGVDLRPAGKRFVFHLSDLPEDTRQAYLDRQAEEAEFDPGQYDDAAHVRLAAETFDTRRRAQENAAKLLFIVQRERAGMSWPQIEAAGKKAFRDFPTRNTMKDWKAKTEGVDPANWAPALAPGWRGGSERHPVSPDAWEMLCACVYFGGKNGTGQPLKAAYQKVAETAATMGWDWPPLYTIRRRWKEMDPIERLAMELGEERAKAMLRLSQPQSAHHMAANDLWDGDGREFKVRCIWPDGYVGCPVVVALVDRASRKTVGWAVGKSENADVTEAAVTTACETHGRPIKIRFDNGGAFNSKRIAGGRHPFFRRKQMKDADWEKPGVLSILQIELANTGVAAKKSNLQENVWSHLCRTDNDPLFHGAQRPGPNDPDGGKGAPIPIEEFERVLAKSIADLNASTDNRVKGLRKGESRDMAFERLSQDRPARIVTPLMKRRLGMVWKRKTVQPDGRIRFDDGFFGDASTQGVMLNFVGKQVLVGFNPNDFNQPAMVCTWEGSDEPGRLLLETLPNVVETAHGSEEGRRADATEKRRIREIFRKLKAQYPERRLDDLKIMLRAQLQEDRPKRDLSDAKVLELPRREGFVPEVAEVEYRPTAQQMKNWADAQARRAADRP
ncbi:Bacteriophage Mu transposase [Maliponia aquimaris]|uniref:Bacteriophage Mu transposase n=1 Tax=Maliponia aquimaris TaxID=1673631 RepID=A0A238L929_9RHOB|nr:Bacteriophage Mu transposase [Maliponia aquimaris]